MFVDTVFQASNFQAQRLSGIRSSKKLYYFIRKHFVYSCLLSHTHVYFPAASYFQSKITQKLTDDFAPLFRHSGRFRQLAYIAISRLKGDFRGEALEKKGTYIDTEDYRCYTDKDSREALVRRLNSRTIPFMKDPKGGEMITSLSDYIKNETKTDGGLYQAVNKHVGSEVQTKKIFAPLVYAVEKQEKAIIPEYIMMKDHNNNIDKYSERLMRLSLLKAYSSSTQQVYGAYSNNPLIQTYDADFFFPYSISFLDTSLFEEFLKLFPEIYNEIDMLRANEINTLRDSVRFKIFRSYYKEFIENLSSRASELGEVQLIFLEERNKQLKNYNASLYEIIKNSELAIMLYKSIAKARKNLQHKIKESTKLFENYDLFFSYALINQIHEAFKNQYEELLMSKLQRVYKRRKKEMKHRIVINGDIFNNGGDVIKNENNNSPNSSIAINSMQGILLSSEDQSDMEKLASAIIEKCNELERSKRFEIASLICNIAEKAKNNGGKPNPDLVSQLKKLFRTLSTTAQAVIAGIAGNLLTPKVIELLGLVAAGIAGG